MCGKTRDMVWLSEQGHRVIGVELSPVAVESFYSDNAMKPAHTHRSSFDISEADRICIMCGNFFDVAANDVKETKAVYDRAALVALPPSLREAYTTHMMEILPFGARMLLVSLEYPAGQMEGPPFAVGVDEVARLYDARASRIDLLRRENVLTANPALAGRGLTEIYENTFLIELS
jgi:thiopurine S-methyltransferase